MEITLIIILVILLVACFAIITYLFIKQNGNDKGEDFSNYLLKQIDSFEGRMLDNIRQMEGKVMQGEREMRKVVEGQFSNASKLIGDITDRMQHSELQTRNAMQYQFENANKLIQEITQELTEVKEGNKQVLTITDQLSNLEKVLKNQKQRGNLGEASLELILSNILPPGAYQMQYEFKDRTKADAIINTKEGIIPVDAKFSLDNYQRIVNEQDEDRKLEYEKAFRQDLKIRIDETSKYIKTEEGTLPFAFMFIPAEGIYYDLLVNEVGAVKVNTRSLIDYAYNEKKVIVVSPTTFYAYLQSVLYGFKAFKIEESARGIEKRVGELGKHLKAYEDYMRKLGATLSTSVNHYNHAYKELGKIDKDVYRITGEKQGIEPELIDRPSLSEEE